MKAELRHHYRTLRESLSAEAVAAASAAICRRLAAWLPSCLPPPAPSILPPAPSILPPAPSILPPAPCILTYLAFRNEPDLNLLFDLLPQVRWAVPRIQDRSLVIHPYDPARLVRHRFGMLEPAADLPVIEPAEIAVVLVPGIAFDRQGRRLGWGGGYYDRFLPTTPALRVGITYDECLITTIPGTESDRRVDWIVTPTRLFAAGHLDEREG